MLQPNVAYLAAFRDGSVKIGTSTLKRRDERLTEQGAWLATIVASSTDGFAIRDLEDKITRDLGLPQSVSSRRKLRGLANPAANEVLRCRLTDHANYVGRLIQQLGDDRLSVMNVPWQSHAVADHVWDNVHKYGPSLNLGCHELNIRAASGRRVAFTRSGHGDVFVADLGPLMGTELELGDFDPVSIAVQDALF